ncbi:alkyl sulfatase C-terminal domain-containing protein [Actinomadura pelletieri]|uniref:alkyl sulfatase C-terminal domain-containing protein n=1 Tax=Actinomadura pelletieri TaxID=111805 RepID=UPI00147764EF|nr:alkyl sulfatase C-terminal domain-containing protein [Actinomadura pelletieri]
MWTVRLADGRLQVQAGETTAADASLRAEPKTLSTLLADPSALEKACDDGSITVVGDLSAIRRLLHAGSGR